MHPDTIMFLVVLALVLLVMIGKAASAIGAAMERRPAAPKRPRATAAYTHAPKVERVSVAPPRFEEPPPRALENIFNLVVGRWHLFVHGPTGTGKSTFMHELALKLKSKGFRVIVLDIQAAPGCWPGCELFGYHGDIGHVKKGLDAFEAQARKRTALHHAGELGKVRALQPVVLVVEEAKNTILKFDGLADKLVEATELYRKLGLFIVLGSQSKMGDLGVKRITAFRSNFRYFVKLVHPDRRQGRREADVTDGQDEWVGHFLVPGLRDWESYVNRNDWRYQEYLDEQPASDDQGLPAQELAHPLLAASIPADREDIISAVLNLVDDLAADLPNVDDLPDDADPKQLDGAQDDEHVYIRPEVFTNSLETIGLADRKAEVERLLYSHGRLTVTPSALQRGRYYHQKRLGKVASAPWVAVRRSQRAVLA